MEILASNVSDALAQGLRAIVERGKPETSRNGPVLVMPNPVITTYVRPEQRVLFSPVRNANPFFHLMESLWMLAGRNDLFFPLQFNSGFKEYSDDGNVLAGAYGFRWRAYFGRDQLRMAISELKRDPTSRRVVIEMWSANDLCGQGKDLPCNTHIYLDCRGAALNMTVCNRSNDLLWGAYGANAVHFSVLLEWLAAFIGVPIGVYRQFSNNLHMYTDVLSKEQAMLMAVDVDRSNHYATKKVYPAPMVNTDWEDWNHDLRMFMRDPIKNQRFNDQFFWGVARPVYEAWAHRADGHLAVNIAKEIQAEDWRLACTEWLQRAVERRAK